MNITKLTQQQRVHDLVSRIPHAQARLGAPTIQIAVVGPTRERCEEMLVEVGLSVMPDTHEVCDGPNYYPGTQVEFFISSELKATEIRGRTRALVLVDKAVNNTQNLRRHNLSHEEADLWQSFGRSLMSFGRVEHVLERDLFIPVGD